MKKATFYFVILIAVFFSSCEDVVKVDLNTATPKLVIEANINWEKGTPGNIQRIKLSTTTSFEIVSSDSSRHSFMIALVLGLKIEYLDIILSSVYERSRFQKRSMISQVERAILSGLG